MDINEIENRKHMETEQEIFYTNAFLYIFYKRLSCERLLNGMRKKSMLLGLRECVPQMAERYLLHRSTLQYHACYVKITD